MYAAELSPYSCRTEPKALYVRVTSSRLFSLSSLFPYPLLVRACVHLGSVSPHAGTHRGRTAISYDVIASYDAGFVVLCSNFELLQLCLYSCSSTSIEFVKRRRQLPVACRVHSYLEQETWTTFFGTLLFLQLMFR